jgi:rod shape-determining protein MreD
MIGLLWQQFDGAARRLLPLLVCLLFLLLGIACTALPGVAGIPPLFGLVAIYYWSVHRPDLLPLSLLFVLGIVADALLRLPFGLSSLSYMGVAQLVQSQRPIFIDQSYLTLWLGFVVVMLLAQGLQWLVLVVLQQHVLPIVPLLLQAGLTLALFPLLVWILIILQRSVVR